MTTPVCIIINPQFAIQFAADILLLGDWRWERVVGPQEHPIPSRVEMVPVGPEHHHPVSALDPAERNPA
jgi:hypothetical protein